MTSEDVKTAKRMTMNLYKLGAEQGSHISGELAQLLVTNAFSQKDKFSNIVQMCLETSDVKLSSVPLNKAVRLIMEARSQIQRPFQSRASCVQSCVLDIVLCSMSFWGQVLEYFESMYYKEVQLPNGDVENSPATVSFETGWAITCLFIRDTMLSSAARSVGMSGGYDRSLSWSFYPGNSTSELEEAKALVLTIIGKIRKRGTVLVSNEGTLGHISFSNSMGLMHWVDVNLEKDWQNVSRLSGLVDEYFERNSLRVNITVTRQASVSQDVPESLMNTSFDENSLENSILDPFDEESSSVVDFSARSISLNVRPINPVLLGSVSCEWSGVDMLDFCKQIGEVCAWPEVVNTVMSEGRIGLSIINMTGQVVAPARRRSSISQIPFSPVKPSEVVLPFTSASTPTGPPPLEPMKASPGFGYLAIPQMTPPAAIPSKTPSAKRTRDSDVTFFGSPIGSPRTALVSLESDGDFSTTQPVSKNRRRSSEAISAPPVSSGPSERRRSSTGGTKPVVVPLDQVAACIVKILDQSRPNAKNWALETLLGEPLMKAGAKSVVHVYNFLMKDEEKRGRKSQASRSSALPCLDEDSLLLPTEAMLKPLLEALLSRCMRFLHAGAQKNLFFSLARVMALAGLFSSGALLGPVKLKSIAATAADFVCFSLATAPLVPASDIYASGLRGCYVDQGIAMFEAAKDLGLLDWLSLSMYYNEEAFALLMGESGLLVPVQYGSPSKKDNYPQKLAKLTPWEKLPQHCLLVCSELMMRWAWAPSSSLWTLYEKLVIDFQNRRHSRVLPEPDQASEEEVAALDYFLKQSLLNAGTYLVDLADRLGVESPLIVHAAFDILRAALLLRPTIMRGRHLYQLVFCALMAANNVFGNGRVVDFERIRQAAVMMQSHPGAQIVTEKFILDFIPLSTADACVLFSDCSGALVLPNDSGVLQPELYQAGNIQEFFEGIFSHEMAQVLFNLSKTHQRRTPDRPRGDMGPFIEKLLMHETLSPCAFTSICSATSLALQLLLGQSDMQHREVSFQHFVRAFPLVSPFGVLSCLIPPVEPAPKKSGRTYKWLADAAIRAHKGTYTVVNL